MKTKGLTILIPLLALFAGCGLNLEKCAEFAPEELEISWTDYNSVKACADYFHCYAGTCKKHATDTIKICGWLPQEGIHPPWYQFTHISPIVDSLCQNQITLRHTFDSIEAPYRDKWLYIKCFPSFYNAMGCCGGEFILLSYDTVPH